MSKPDTNKNLEQLSADQTRRSFIAKFGKLAAVTPVAVSALMSPATSAAPRSCRGNGTKKCT
ncbi:hypothetical protein [Thalassotalea atypica]|uniref:hypothetical protein n=1 Tax=Thalassotalea atypica TaxID=2054316 RepID=UPI002573B791|nr:hypothetical protein [Thalassotalea atypica]